MRNGLHHSVNMYFPSLYQVLLLCTTFVHERYKGGFEIAAQMKCTYLCSLILNKKKSYFLN